MTLQGRQIESAERPPLLSSLHLPVSPATDFVADDSKVVRIHSESDFFARFAARSRIAFSRFDARKFTGTRTSPSGLGGRPLFGFIDLSIAARHRSRLIYRLTEYVSPDGTLP